MNSDDGDENENDKFDADYNHDDNTGEENIKIRTILEFGKHHKEKN